MESANESEGEESAAESESETRNTCSIPIQICPDKNVQLNNKEAAEALKLMKQQQKPWSLANRNQYLSVKQGLTMKKRNHVRYNGNRKIDS